MYDKTNLKNLIESKGIKMVFLAKKLGIDKNTFSLKINKDNKEFTESEIKTICEVLGIPKNKVFDYFF